jgi:hypothetical protein
MALIDELAGSLSPAVIARIKAKPDVFKEVIDMYYAEDGDEKPTTTTTPPVAAAATSNNPFSLADIESALDKRLGAALDERIKTTAGAAIEDVIKTRANELIGQATERSIRSADELNRVYRRHEKEFGEDFDSIAFDKYITEQRAAGHNFSSITSAYEDWTRDKRTEKTIETRVNTATEELKKKKANNEMVPGVTPASARSPISTFINRGKTTDKEGTTAAQRAGAALDEALARRGNLE